MKKSQFFDHILWIDSNLTINYEVNVLTTIFAGRFELFQTPQKALDFIQQKDEQDKENTEGRCLIICSSRNISEIYQVLGKIENVFPKYIVFCGSQYRAEEVKQTEPYNALVLEAYWEIDLLIDGITKIDEMLRKDNSSMNKRIQILINQQVRQPVIQQVKAQVNEQIKEPVNLEIKHGKIPHLAKSSKLLGNTRIFVLVERVEQINEEREHWVNEMSRGGYPATDINTSEDLARSISSSESPIILVALGNKQIPDKVTTAASVLLYTFRLTSEKCENTHEIPFPTRYHIQNHLDNTLEQTLKYHNII